MLGISITTMAVFIVVLLLVLATFVMASAGTNLTGFWVAPADFCETANLTMFMLCLTNNRCPAGSIGYLVVANADGVLINTDIAFCIACGRMTLSMVDDSEWPYGDILPRDLRIQTWPKHNKIALYSGDQLHAVLYKDAELSEALKAD